MNELNIWNDNTQLASIRDMYAKGSNDAEFNTFLQIGKGTELNPFLREIWFVKYGGDAQIFIGRDGYRKVIGKNPNYQSHIVDAVYENDKFMVDHQNGSINHVYNLNNRGALMGAYCCVYMKNSPRPFFVYAELKEYNSFKSLWKTKPATMIKKVAECQAIRMAIPAELNGTYSPDEMEKPAVVNKPSYEKEKEKLLHFITKESLSEGHKKLLDQIKDADDTGELHLVGEALQNADLDDAHRNFFANEYKEKLNSLRDNDENR